MPTGKIKWFDPQIGAGFIRSDEGEDVFFRSSVYKGRDAREIREGQSVRFDIARNARTISQSATRVNGCH